MVAAFTVTPGFVAGCAQGYNVGKFVGQQRHLNVHVCASRKRRSFPLATLTDSTNLEKGSSAPEKRQAKTFQQAYEGTVPAWLLQRLEDLGFEYPTPVQSQTLELALPAELGMPGRDVVIHAQTGSGKTLAYLLPMLATIDPSRACIQALIIVPTQELGMQVYRLVRRLVSAYLPTSEAADALEEAEYDDDIADQQIQNSFPVLPMLNQADLRRQKLQLRKTAPRVIVGNPKRIAELVESGRLRLDLLKVLVVDEFDACLLDTATTQALQAILSVRGREGPRQTILASATVPQHRHFLRQCVRQRWTRADIKHVWIEESSGEVVPPSLRHLYAICEGPKKLAALRALLIKFSEERNRAELDEDAGNLNVRAMVFVMPSRSIDVIVDALNRSLDDYYNAHGANFAVGISNNLSIAHRRDVMKRFRDGDARVLVATDVAARGLDIPDLSHIFHFDLPTDPDSYLHRAGRAGRQGREGSSVVLITTGEQFVIRRTGNALGIEFERIGR